MASRISHLPESFVSRSFVQVCHEALVLNQRLISAEQLEYHESLIKNFGNFVTRLEDIFDEKVGDSCLLTF